jgi:hypothetical protein
MKFVPVRIGEEVRVFDQDDGLATAGETCAKEWIRL